MGEIGKYLRYLIHGDKIAKITALTVTTTPQGFTSSLDTATYSRKHLNVYNLSPYASGECFYAFSDISGELTSSNGYPLPPGAEVTLKVAKNIEVFFIASSGEIGDLRIKEIA